LSEYQKAKDCLRLAHEARRVSFAKYERNEEWMMKR